MNHDEEQGSLFLERALKSQINLTLFLRDSCVLSVLLRRRKKTLTVNRLRFEKKKELKLL